MPNTGAGAGANSGTAADVRKMFVGMSRSDILSYISDHVPSMSWDTSTSTDTYVNAYAIYLDAQKGIMLADFPSKDYGSIVSGLNDLQRKRANVMYMPEPNFSYTYDSLTQGDIDSLTPEAAAPRGVTQTQSGPSFSDDSGGLAFQRDFTAATAATRLQERQEKGKR
jgi:hypothetical protein